MAHGLTLVARCLLPLIVAGVCSAQEMRDPMRPPGFAGQGASDLSGAGSSVLNPSGPVLQSTLLSEGRRIAMIDGKPMKIGDKIGDARITAIDPASVTLREGKTTRVLELFQGIKITRPKPPAPKPPASPQRSAKAPRG